MKNIITILFILAIAAPGFAMPVSIDVDIPDGSATEIINAICNATGYQAEIDGEPNPVSKAQHAKAILRAGVIKDIKKYLKRARRAVANSTITSDVNALDFDGE